MIILLLQKVLLFIIVKLVIQFVQFVIIRLLLLMTFVDTSKNVKERNIAVLINVTFTKVLVLLAKIVQFVNVRRVNLKIFNIRMHRHLS